MLTALVRTDGVLPVSRSRSRAAAASTASDDLGHLVEELPEIYQPIFGHPELSVGASRRSDDRLAEVTSAYKALETALGRPLRVLDLGCGQGYFSHHLARLGASVHGVDFLEPNITVCRALAAEHGHRGLQFENARVEDVLARLQPDRYDLLLGLSIFHHIAAARGANFVRDMLAAAAPKVAAALFEMALAEEPTFWAAEQPASARDLLGGYAFVHEIARFDTHLSDVRRPLYFASSQCWYLGGRAATFARWTAVSNARAPEIHGGTRRFFFSDKTFVSLSRLDDGATCKQNLLEWENTVAFLSDPPAALHMPQLESYGRNDAEAWLVRELLPGMTLERHIAEGHQSYDPQRVLNDVLLQLRAMEAVGLYHNDLRTWNVIVDPTGRATLIDYGAISKSRMDCTWPNDVFLSFLIFMREVLVGVQEFPAPARAGWFNPDRLPEPYRSAVWRMLHVSFDQWRFADFVDNFASGKDGGVDAPAQIDRGNAAVLLAALESGIAELRAQIANLESHTARYDHLIKNLQVPNAPRALKLVLPLARLVRVLRGALSGS